MDRPSSTSSSDATPPPPPPHRFGVPWALLGALVLLLAFDVALRFVSPYKLIAYRNGLDEHFAAAQYVTAHRVPQIVFLGSSMTRTGIDAPTVRRQLRIPLGRDVPIGNFGMSNAVADEFLAAFRHMRRKGDLPRVLLVEVGPRTFREARGYRLNEKAAFLRAADLPAAYRRYGSAANELLPHVVRNHLEDVSLTTRYRKRFRFLAQEHLLNVPPSPAPMAGKVPRRVEGRATMAARRRQQASLAAWMELDMPDGRFPLDQQLATDLESLVAEAKSAGVVVILYEMPWWPPSYDRLPAGTHEAFLSLADGIARRHGIPFIRASEVNVDLADRDFEGVYHLTADGAERFSEALVRDRLGQVLREKLNRQ
jgi:hypothetical protein